MTDRRTVAGARGRPKSNPIPANDGKIRDRAIQHDSTLYRLPEENLYYGIISDSYLKETENTTLFFVEVDIDGVGTFVNCMAESFVTNSPFNCVLLYAENKNNREALPSDLIGINIKFTVETVVSDKTGKDYCTFKSVEVVNGKSSKAKSINAINTINDVLDDDDAGDRQNEELSEFFGDDEDDEDE